MRRGLEARNGSLLSGVDLEALLPRTLNTIRPARRLMERVRLGLLLRQPGSPGCGFCGRWLGGLGIDAAVREASSFAKNRDRVAERDAAAEPLAGVVNQPDMRRRMGRDPFSVDGTLIDA
jgi:hypothetical protein